MLRILQVSHRYWPYVGGSERYVQEISERLVRDGHEVTVYTTDAWDLEAFWDPSKKRLDPGREFHGGVDIHRYPVRYLPWPRLSFAGIRWTLARLSALPIDTTALLRYLARLAPWVPELEQAMAAQGRFDVVHGTNISFEALLWPALAMARRTGAAFIVTPFTHLGEDGDRVATYYTMRHQTRLLQQADALIVPTEIERRHLIGRGVDAAKIIRAGVGVDPDSVLGGVSERFRAKYGIHRPFVFSLGTAAYDKGSYHLVAAMSRLWQQGLDVHLVLAGPPMDAFLWFYQKQPSWVRERCHVLRFISEDDKRDLLAAGAVLAMPSRTDAFGIVYLEAWLYGIPVIGARAGGVPEVISDGLDGFLVRFGDVPALTDCLGKLLAAPTLARRMGDRGRQKVLQHYTWDRIYPIVRDVYEQVGRQRGRRSVS